VQLRFVVGPSRLPILSFPNSNCGRSPCPGGFPSDPAPNTSVRIQNFSKFDLFQSARRRLGRELTFPTLPSSLVIRFFVPFPLDFLGAFFFSVFPLLHHFSLFSTPVPQLLSVTSALAPQVFRASRFAGRMFSVQRLPASARHCRQLFASSFVRPFFYGKWSPSPLLALVLGFKSLTSKAPQHV